VEYMRAKIAGANNTAPGTQPLTNTQTNVSSIT